MFSTSSGNSMNARATVPDSSAVASIEVLSTFQVLCRWACSLAILGYITAAMAPGRYRIMLASLVAAV